MRYVQKPADLAGVVAEVAETDLLAADTEAAGYHRYLDRVCLVQLSTRSSTVIIDALAVRDLRPLAGPLADPGIETVFHDADYDLRLLNRDFGLVVNGLFDTRIAAQFLGEPAIGLASLVEKHLGVRMEKKYQRADWARRPLPQELLAYAAEDTRHLPALRDRLRAELVARGRLEWAEEEFRLAEAVRWSGPADDGDAYLRIKGARDLGPRQLAALRELHGWRERVAEARDVASFRVLSNDALVALARHLPQSPAALADVPGMPRSVAERAGAELVAAVRRALSLPEEELPTRPRGPRRPAPDPTFEEKLDRLRGARDRAADRLELDRGFLMPRSQLEELARRRPRTLAALASIPGLRRWQVEAAGQELLAALSE